MKCRADNSREIYSIREKISKMKVGKSASEQTRSYVRKRSQKETWSSGSF